KETNMDLVHSHCVGLDVHKKTVVASRIAPDAAGELQQQTRTFATMTAVAQDTPGIQAEGREPDDRMVEPERDSQRLEIEIQRRHRALCEPFLNAKNAGGSGPLHGPRHLVCQLCINRIIKSPFPPRLSRGIGYEFDTAIVRQGKPHSASEAVHSLQNRSI